VSLDLEDADTGTPAVAGEPAAADDDDREGCELVDGVWVEKEGDMASGVVEVNIGRVLSLHARAHRLGWVMGGSTQYQLLPGRPNQVRKPDVSFVAAARLPNGLPGGNRMRFAPDLAVEVHSPTDLVDYTEAKRDEYLRAGVRLVWEVHVPTRNVWVYKPDGTGKLYRATDTLPGEDVLPGFGVPVAELFDGLDPPGPAPAGPAPGSPGSTATSP
jgi:Uma2 family endonuclease